MSTKAKKPKTEREWIAYRCQLECKLVRDALNDPLLRDFGAEFRRERRIEYALFCLAGAVSELSKQMEAK